MDKPLVTIITATYNIIKAGRSEYIKQCIESVHNQTYENIEHIIIDGASSDGTLDLLNEYEKKGWIKIYSEPDEGIYFAMNKGIDKANGKYIAFLNSDDFWHDIRGIETSINKLEENNADFSYSTVNYIGENSEFIGYLKPVMESFMLRMPFSHQSMFTKTDKMRKLNKFDTQYKSAADYDFVLRLILSGAKGIDTQLNFTTFRYCGFSADNTLGAQECIKILENSHKNYGIETDDYSKHWYNRECPINYVNAILQDINQELKEKITNAHKIWTENKEYYKMRVPLVSKVKIIFYADNLSDFSAEIFKRFSECENLEIYLYYDYSKKKEISKFIKEKKKDLSDLKEFWGNIADYDIFFSPNNNISDEIKQSGIPCYTLRSMPENDNFDITKNQDNALNLYYINCNQEMLENPKTIQASSWKDFVNKIISNFANLPLTPIKDMKLKTVKKIKILGFIPLLKIIKDGNKKWYFLFGIIPLF